MSVKPEANRSAWEDNAKEEEKSESFHTLAEQTTLHGIGKTVNSQYSFTRRILWVVVLLAMLGLFLNIFIRGILTYLEYPSATKISLVSNTHLDAPAVTICNNNAVRKSYVDAAIQEGGPSAEEWFNVYQPYILGFPSSWQAEDYPWANNTDGVKFEREGMVPIDEAFRDCWLGGQPAQCSDLDIDIVLTAERFCYKIILPTGINKAGPKSGLIFVMNLRSDEYGSLAKSIAVGTQMMVHDRNQIAPESRMFSISPGSEVYVALSKTEITRLGRPWSTEDCREEKDVPDYRFSSTYTQDGCQMECYSKHVQQHCGCDIFGDHDSLPNCTMLQQYPCQNAAYESVFGNDSLNAELGCECIKPCHESVYNADVTTMQAPSHYSVDHIYKPYFNIDLDYMRESFMIVYIYFKTLDVELVEQVKSYTFNQFAADVGGQMGLFLGASIITVSEFLEFIIVFITQRLNKSNKTSRPSSQPQSF